MILRLIYPSHIRPTITALEPKGKGRKENAPMKQTLARALALLALLGIGGTAHAQTIVSYFNFNDARLGSPAEIITPNAGNGSLSTDFDTGNTIIKGAGNGTTLNAEGSDPADGALFIPTSSGSNNGRYLQLSLSTLSFSSLTLSYATNRNTEGFTGNQLSYSVNGGAFTNFGLPYVVGEDYAVARFDLSSITALNNQSDVRFRITFSGAVAGGGGASNSIDNLKVTVPAPASVAVMALGGIVPLLHFARRRRKDRNE